MNHSWDEDKSTLESVALPMFRFSPTPKKQTASKKPLTIVCPEYGTAADSVINFTEPVDPRLDLDLARGAERKKNREAIHITSTNSETSEKQPPTPSTPKSPAFLLFSPSKIISRLQSKKAKNRDTLAVYPSATALSFDTSRLSLPVQASKVDRCCSEGGSTIAKPLSSDEETEKQRCGYHIRKSTAALSAEDFDSMLFHEETPTLKLTLTPKWLHSGV
ncbi:hypothetical protein DSO57_1038720 [Entomophthora muscae]|uniref:Uncharacterized protein n=1 Tax=Entomophthora muscae TaxID=34485 RepID=A0ACC2TL09_9FUNG|nr:hypothetical protein DSO57_1038720 [Entomophthora muscae]